jgi:oxygen-independent coproporphyrinogen-3 oxidase
MPPEHLYVHVPFCEGKCDYCALYSTLFDADTADRYLVALAREVELLARGFADWAPRTLYVGGGTPSALGPQRLRRLFALLADRVDLSRLAEWTVELNPATATPAVAAELARAGVNRVSFGAQSFQDGLLAGVGRPHRAAAVGAAVEGARAEGIANIGLDLIACLPGATAADWQCDLEHALALRPEHLSVYCLAVEPGTRLEVRVRSGSASRPDPGDELQRLATAESVLTGAGLQRYEISSFARHGRECAHNLAVWHGEDYAGVGPAAASRAGRRRWHNAPDVRAYCDALLRGTEPPRETERPDERVDLTERFVFSFRVLAGTDMESFAARHAVPGTLLEAWRRALGRLESDGLVRTDGARTALTAKGRRLADCVSRALWEVIDP